MYASFSTVNVLNEGQIFLPFGICAEYEPHTLNHV